MKLRDFVPQLTRRPPDRTVASSRRSTATGGRIALIPFAELHAMPAPTYRWQLEGLLQAGDLLVVAAPPKALKSHVLLQALALLSHGEGSLFGAHPVAGPAVPTVYYDGENGVDETRRRMLLMAQSLGATAEIPLYVQPPVGLRLNQRADLDEMLRATERVNARVVALDPLVEIGGGTDENDNIAVHRLIRTIWDPLRERGVSVIIAHHTRKGRGPHGSVGTSADAARGASSIRGAATASMVIDPRGWGRYMISIEGRAFARREYLVKFDATTGLLHAVEDTASASTAFTPLEQRILDRLAEVSTATQSEVRTALDESKSSVSDAMRRLRAEGVLESEGGRWWLAEAGELEDTSG